MDTNHSDRAIRVNSCSFVVEVEWWVSTHPTLSIEVMARCMKEAVALGTRQIAASLGDSLSRNTRRKLFWRYDVILFAFRDEADAGSSLRGGTTKQSTSVIVMAQEQARHCANVRGPCRQVEKIAASLAKSRAEHDLDSLLATTEGRMSCEGCWCFSNKPPTKGVRCSQR